MAPDHQVTARGTCVPALRQQCGAIKPLRGKLSPFQSAAPQQREPAGADYTDTQGLFLSFSLAGCLKDSSRGPNPVVSKHLLRTPKHSLC